MFSRSRRNFMLAVIVIGLLVALTQGLRLVVFGQPADPASPDPDQAPLNVAVDESLFSSGNEDFAGVEGPAWQLDKAIGPLTQPLRAVITDPTVPVAPGGQKITDILVQDEKRRIEARRELIVTEEKLAQRFINTIIEQETAYYVDLLEQVITNLNTTRASWEQVKAGVRYVNSQTATNKG